MNTIHNWTDEYLEKAIKTTDYIANGGSLSCGHSDGFWENAKKAEGGHFVFCEQCGQFFVKCLGFPWICEDTTSSYDKSNHLESDNVFYYPVFPKFSRDAYMVKRVLTPIHK
jgi:hypothetical protein